ncbi:hypothetical protein BDA99DRAFT_499487 [Phascolomyces articulosus]|uniref:Uncharacterized protein n=1 Tax=Phascolomyces articulosus TaxID=60185 RepID=A0AAD5K7Z1_9FUNG|nr:hypothetical protein BDA99DRAFT_499487 [Phascolomyces articulosus]
MVINYCTIYTRLLWINYARLPLLIHFIHLKTRNYIGVLYYDVIHKYKSETDLMQCVRCFIDCAFDVEDVNVSTVSASSHQQELTTSDSFSLPVFTLYRLSWLRCETSCGVLFATTFIVYHWYHNMLPFVTTLHFFRQSRYCISR